MRKRVFPAILAMAVLWVALAPAVQAVLPAYIAKPLPWTSKLVTNAGPFVTDVQFAQWVKGVQGLPPAAPRFSFLAGFHQCYGGGFLTELQRQGVRKFGANSASRFFEPASYDVPNQRSYFTYSWFTRAITPVGSNDQLITDDAYNWTVVPPAAPPIPANPWAAWENAQYLSDPGFAAPPEKIGAAQNKYAILWAGRPDGKDVKDANQVYQVLTANYGFARNNILVLWGNVAAGAAVPGAGGFWNTSDGPALAANLQNAFAVWLNGKLNAQPMGQTAQVVFWAGDHGSADFPILISVDNGSLGLAASAVNNRVLGGRPPGPVIYEAGGGTNRWLWEVLGGPPDVDEIAFSEQSVQNLFDTKDGGWIYFSVDRNSPGAGGSDVNRDFVANGGASSSVYSATPNSNRLAFADQDLGLRGGNADNLNALSLRNSQSVLNPMNKMPNRPLFFSFLGSSQVNVYDPVFNGWYLYYDFTWDFPVAPWELDGLALWDDGVRDPMTNLLYFDPFGQDRLLFSVGRQENAFPWNAFAACDILKLGPMPGGAVLARWRSCQQIGLVPGPDNLDALDLGIGANGEPYDSYPPSYTPPSYPNPGPSNPWPGSVPDRGPRKEPVIDLSTSVDTTKPPIVK
jgi:hypothetical protein